MASGLFITVVAVVLNFSNLSNSAVYVKRSAGPDQGNIYFETDQVVAQHHKDHPSGVGIRLGTSTTTTTTTTDSSIYYPSDPTPGLGPRPQAEPIPTTDNPDVDVTTERTEETVETDDANDTDVRSEESKSQSHQCPTPKQRYHKETGACYDTGRVGGPCGNNMVFLREPDNNIYGDCDCKSSRHDVPYVYHTATDQCYPTYDQAYCPDNQWLVFEADKPVCQPRKCAKPVDSSKTFIYFKEKCVRLNASKPDLCVENPLKQQVGFAPGEVTPSCIHYVDSEEFNIPPPKAPCAPGTKRNFLGRCQGFKNVNTESRVTTTPKTGTASTARPKSTRRPRPTVMISFINKNPRGLSDDDDDDVNDNGMTE